MSGARLVAEAGRGRRMSAEEALDERLGTLVKEKDRQAFKTGLYTVGLALVALLAGAGAWAVYKLFSVFIVPIYWALLIGTVLFPLKTAVSGGLSGWLSGLEKSDTPLLLGIVSLPFRGLHAASDAIWALIASKQIFIVAGGWLCLKLITTKGVFYAIISLILRFHDMVDWVIETVASKYVTPFFIIYGLVFLAWAYVQPQDWDSMRMARFLSVPLWFYGLVYVSSFFGPVRVVVLLALSALIAAIALQLILPSHVEEATAPSEPEQPAKEEVATTKELAKVDGEEDSGSLGNVYLKGIVAASALLWTVRHPSLLSLAAVPFVYTLTRKIAEGSGLTELLTSRLGPIWQSVKEKVGRVTNLLIPQTMKKFARCLYSGDQWLVRGLAQASDTLSSVVVLLGMALFLVVGSFWVVFQVQAEVSHLVTLGTSLVRDSAGDTEGLVGTALNYTGITLDEEQMDEYVEKAYVEGRAWLATQVRSLAHPKDKERADMLEDQVKLLLDKLYEIYQKAAPFSQDSAKAAEDSGGEVDLWGQVTGIMDVSKITAELTKIAQDNLDAIKTIGETIWGVVSSNAALLSSMVGAVAGVVLGFGMDFINFIIELIVFMTMVYYLLASSKEQWKPLEWLGQASGGKGAKKEGAASSAITKAVEEAIAGVFLLSGKMAVFYSLYTWFIHSIFQLNIVFIPSILAGVLAAVPLTSPGAVCAVGVVELWLVKGEAASAALFAAASFAPLAFADAAFYAEVRLAHPYVTGLAIVGGMYWLGPKGALIGPILLCSSLVLLKLLKAIRQQ